MSEEGDIEIGEWQRVNPLTVAVTVVKIAAQALIPIVFALYGIGRDAGTDGFAMGALIFGLGGIALLAILAGSAWLSWYRLQYRIGDNDIKLEQGIVSRSARSVPYDRIQDVSLEQKLVPRLLGLVEVKFETGAGGKEELKLSYVSEQEGERLRETVRALVDGADTQPLVPTRGVTEGETAVPERESRTIFAMDNRRLFTFGLFEFSLVIFAVILGAAQQLEFLLPFDVWDYVEEWIDDARYTEAGRYFSGMDAMSRVLGVLYLLATVVGVGLLSGIVKTFLRDWEFRLDRTAKGFRRRRGLLTKTDVVMPVHRVQSIIVSTGWWRRRFGWHGLKFVSLAQDSGSANHDVAPFAKMHEIEPIAEEAGFTLPDERADWHRPSRKYYTDRAVIRLLILVPTVSVVVAALISDEADLSVMVGPFLAINTALAALIVAREVYRWHRDRHALDPAQVVSRRGWLSPRTQVANRVKLHSVEISQGPLARWRGYCDLKFGMAGGRFSFRGLREDDARKLRSAVLDSIASVDFAKLAR